ncbi:hypothetical protein CN285_27355 [Bacillus cereus]|nr:hypothetical protein CN285_27355 [Bacillus cereus]
MDKHIEWLISQKKRIEFGLYIISTFVFGGLIVGIAQNNQELKSFMFGIIGSLVGGVFAYFIAIMSILTTTKIEKSKTIPDKISKIRHMLIKLNVVLLPVNMYVRSPLSYKLNKRQGKALADKLVELSNSISGIGIEVNNDVDNMLRDFFNKAIRNKYFHFISIPTSLELGEEELLTTEEFEYLFELHANLNGLIAKLEECLHEYEVMFENSQGKKEPIYSVK